MGREATVNHKGPGTAPGRSKGARDQHGGGLIEALLALLLLASSTLGTLAAFTGAERGNHSALLRLAAVDLAADAAEELRALAVTTDWTVATWQAAAATRLPSRASGGAALDAPVAEAVPDGSGWRLTLRWLDPADGAAQSLTRRVDLAAAP